MQFSWSLVGLLTLVVVTPAATITTFTNATRRSTAVPIFATEPFDAGGLQSFTGITFSGGLAAPAFAVWSPPMEIRESTEIFFPRLATSAAGEAVALWVEPEQNSFRDRALMGSFLTPGSDWSAGATIAKGDLFSEQVVMAPDGTVIAIWFNQILQSPTSSYESQLVAQKFVPRVGWGAPQILGHDASAPALAISPDGRGQLVFFEGQDVVATNLASGEGVWSPLATVGHTNVLYGIKLAAGNGFAYATFATFATVELAFYDAQGWHLASTLSTSGIPAAGQDLAFNSGQVIASWYEYANSSTGSVHWVQRLTRNSEKFTVPPPYNALTLLQDGTVLAAGSVEGDLIPGCIESSHNGPTQARGRYIQTAQRPFSGDWSPPEIVSDRGKRIGDIKLLANGKGDGFLVWSAETPCMENSREFLSRVRSSVSSFWQPEEQLADSSAFVHDLALDRRGSLRALLLRTEADPSRMPPYIFTLYARELAIYGSGGPASREQ